MGKKTLICDTNVFYNLGAGSLTKQAICQDGEQLYYSPLSILEIAGRLSDRNFNERKAAAQAILHVGAIQLPDPESFRTELYGYEMTEPPLDASSDVVVIAGSRDMKSLSARADVTWAKELQEAIGRQWHDDMLHDMGQEIPGFLEWYQPDPTMRKGAVPRLKGEDKTVVSQKLDTPQFLDYVILARQPLAAYHGALPDWSSFEPTPEQVKHCDHARERMRCYACMYREYLSYLQTASALPQANDSIDLELFIYCIDDDHVLVTSEKKWVALAMRAGYSQRVRRV